METILEKAENLGPFGCISLQVEAGTADYAELAKIMRLEEMKVGGFSEFKSSRTDFTIHVFRSSDTSWDINIVAGMDGVLGRY